KDEMNATVAQMNKLHGEAMERINQTAATVEVLRERMSHMVTRAELQELRSEFMDRIGRVETCMGEVKSELKLIRWIGGALGIAIIAGLVRIIFFPVV
ncbi:MAG: hypothetical protein OXU44_06005, partial [Gammaproteobacteria bacterium]|nr:hypothetical protein [Gammaproteobacteria bacterium]